MHSGKDAGLSGAFGVGSGSGKLGGGSLVERNLNRWTIAFGILFAVNTILPAEDPWEAGFARADAPGAKGPRPERRGRPSRSQTACRRTRHRSSGAARRS